MKTASAELIAYLNSTTEFLRCDLYEITLSSGTVLRYADYELPITLTDGRVFQTGGPLFERGRTKLSSKISVDSMSVSMFVTSDDTISGTPIMTISRNGGFDEATCSVLICYMSAPGVVVDTLEWFTGLLDIKDGGGLEIAMESKSMIQKANIDYPMRKYYPTCPYSLYSAGCGVNIASFRTSGTITGVINTQQFYISIPFADGYYDSGAITFTSGTLTGTTMSIKTSTNYLSKLITLISLDDLPSIGDTFTIVPGCTKTPEICNSRFGNIARNRATPYIPLKETVV